MTPDRRQSLQRLRRTILWRRWTGPVVRALTAFADRILPWRRRRIRENAAFDAAVIAQLKELL